MPDTKKALLLPGVAFYKQKEASFWTGKARWAALLLLALAASVSTVLLPAAVRQTALPSASSACSANERICWTPCGPNIYCGSVTVPLDYTNASDARTIKLALAKYSAPGRDAKLGTLVIEPGGPGGSGTQMVWNSGANISRVVEGRYEVLGWDPRGINGSEPKVDCWGSEEERKVYARAVQKLPSDGRSSLAEVDAWYEVMAKGCAERAAEAIPYVSTAFVARDLDQIREAVGEETLTYWGISYGTGIGATYTAMFPDRVGRVVLDACEYPVDGRSALMWGKTSLDDVTKVFEAFLETCASVGPARCPLIKVPGTTAVDLRLQIESLLVSLSHRPIAVARSPNPGIVTRHTVLSFLYSSLYRPNAGWVRLAEVLDALVTSRNGSLLLDEMAWKDDVAPKSEEGIAVICSDSVPANEISLEEWEVQTRAMVQTSFISGEIRSLHTLPCRTWLGRPKERYVGNFSKTLANPVLLIGGTHDPATPLRNARRLAADMGESARLVVHHGYGHSSLRHISNCTTEAVRDLLLNGALPEAAETHCMPTEELFPAGGDEFASASLEERVVLQAMRGIAEALPVGL